MIKRKKLWSGMQAVAFVGVASVSACSEDNVQNAAEMQDTPAPSQAMQHGEGAHGEGEGEGVSATGADLSTDDAAYQAQLGLMRGHLLVGNALYQEGFIDHAKTHMKHPESELYADVAEALISRGGKGFADELNQLAEAVNQEKGDEAVAAAYQTIVALIKEHEQLVAEESQSAIAQMRWAASLLRTAADEYAIGVIDGKTSNVHEYQDAYGFTLVAQELIKEINSEDLAVKIAQKNISNVLTEVLPIWPAIVPGETVDGSADKLYGAAAQIEIVALGLE